MFGGTLVEVKNEIVNFMDWAGINYKIQGREAYPIAHDSLKIPLKPGKSYFNWYSRGENAWGHLKEFVMSFDGDGFKPLETEYEANKLIREFRRSKHAKRSHKIDYDHSQFKKFDFMTIRKEKAPWRSMEYLYEKRKLEPKFIKGLFESELIAEDAKHHDILFLWRDSTNKKVGADVQGTVLQKGKKRPYFKMILPGSKRDYGWSFNYGARENANKIVITEAPIDALSYFQSFGKDLPNTVFASISGSATKIDSIDNLINETIIKQGNSLKELHIAVDNDAAGYKTIQELQQPEWQAKHPFKIIVDMPKFGKDWNEMVQLGKVGKYSIDLQNFKPEAVPVIKDRQRSIAPAMYRKSKSISR